MRLYEPSNGRIICVRLRGESYINNMLISRAIRTESIIFYYRASAYTDNDGDEYHMVGVGKRNRGYTRKSSFFGENKIILIRMGVKIVNEFDWNVCYHDMPYRGINRVIYEKELFFKLGSKSKRRE
jgi:hypothetical protein